jgi:hypothetical protein
MCSILPLKGSGRVNSSISGTTCCATFAKKNGDKSWKRIEGPDCEYDTQNINMVICDTDITYPLSSLLCYIMKKNTNTLSQDISFFGPSCLKRHKIYG